MSPSAPVWWTPDQHLRRRPHLMARAQIIRALRQWFETEGFVEIEAAALQVSPGNETHLHGFATDLVTTDGQVSQLYLHTSPEFAAKKLLSAGETQICAFSHVFRNRERTPLHHPEFMMLEWYRAQRPYEDLMADCGALLALAMDAAGTHSLIWRDKSADPRLEPERLTVAEAFLRYANIDLLATLQPDGATDRQALASFASAIGIQIASDDSWSDIFSRVLSELIEPELGSGRATILMEYPVCEAALARPKAADPRVAERFELYACGVELANAFGELTDPVEQRRRFESDMDLKAQIYGERYPVDEEFLSSLAFMPDASGIALGLDRLVMLASHAAHIEDVIWTPVAARGTARP